MRGRREELIGHIGVDSGQMMLIDPCYISGENGSGYKDTAAPSREEFEEAGTKSAKTLAGEGKLTLDYKGACMATCSRDSGGILGNETAAVVSSGYGDGLYPVYATYNDGSDGWGVRIVELRIDFDPPEQYECSNCGEELRYQRDLCDECEEEAERREAEYERELAEDEAEAA